MNILKTTIACSSLAFMLTAGASQALAADDSQQSIFKGWVGESSDLVSSKMKYPYLGPRHGNESAIQIYNVTVNAEGEVNDFKLITRRGQKRLANASDRLLDRIESFPKLPEQYYSDELTFVLVMDYNASPRMTRSVWDNYHSTRTRIFDISATNSNDEIVLLSTGALRGR